MRLYYSDLNSEEKLNYKQMLRELRKMLGDIQDSIPVKQFLNSSMEEIMAILKLTHEMHTYQIPPDKQKENS